MYQSCIDFTHYEGVGIATDQITFKQQTGEIQKSSAQVLKLTKHNQLLQKSTFTFTNNFCLQLTLVLYSILLLLWFRVCGIRISTTALHNVFLSSHARGNNCQTCFVQKSSISILTDMFFSHHDSVSSGPSLFPTSEKLQAFFTSGS